MVDREAPATRQRDPIFTIDAKTCKATSEELPGSPAPGRPAGPGHRLSDGAIWVADIGDAERQPRPSRGVREGRARRRQRPTVPYRMTYPDGPRRRPGDAARQGRHADHLRGRRRAARRGIYKPAKALVPGDHLEPADVGEDRRLHPGQHRHGQPAGPRSARRSSPAPPSRPTARRSSCGPPSDAYEYTVGADGDVVKAITTARPASPAAQRAATARRSPTAPTAPSSSRWGPSRPARPRTPKLLSYTPVRRRAADTAAGRPRRRARPTRGGGLPASVQAHPQPADPDRGRGRRGRPGARDRRHRRHPSGPPAPSRGRGRVRRLRRLRRRPRRRGRRPAVREYDQYGVRGGYRAGYADQGGYGADGYAQPGYGSRGYGPVRRRSQ